MDFKRFTTWRGGYAFAACLVALASLALLPFRPYLTPTTVMLLYVPIIIVAGRAAGARASAVSAVLGFLALDLLFVPPYYHLVVASVAEWSALLVFLVVALVSGQQTGVLREREQAALDRQRELEFLNRLSFRVASEKSLQPTAEFIASQITEVLGATRTALYLGTPGAPSAECLAQAGDPMPSSGEAAVVAWVVRTGAAVGMPDVPGLGVEEGVVTVGADEAVPGVSAEGLYLPLHGARGLQGALYTRFSEPERPTADDARLLVAVANLAAASLERQRLEEEAAHADVLREADRLKATFVSSISHELKTPLAAATARVTGLVDEREHVDSERVWEELAEVSDDLQRLNGSIGDLLDLSRLESDAWRPHLEHYELDEVLGTVLARLPAEKRGRVRFDLPADPPVVNVDFAQIARAIGQLVENALAYSPPDSPVIVGASERGDVRVWVEDSGPGIDDAEKSRVFEKFYRGAASPDVPTGTGLGLVIAREIVRSHDGTLLVEDVEPHGARFVMILPSPAEKEPS